MSVGQFEASKPTSVPVPDGTRPRLGKWTTVQGPHAFCDGCPWHMHGDNDAKRLMSAARFHARDTGHTIQIQRGQLAVMRCV